MEIKKLASQTAIYGLSSMIGRFLNFLLVPLYTATFLPEAYGVVSVLYAYAGFFAVLLTYGMETAFFNFSRKTNNTIDVYTTATGSLMVSSAIFVLLGFVFSSQLASLIGYEGHADYIKLFALILACDALSTLPFALLRKENKAWRFAGLKLINIAINILLNLYFIKWGYDAFAKGDTLPFFNAETGVGYIFIANLVASAVTLVLLLPELGRAGNNINRKLLKDMFAYAWPLLLVGFAGMINEVLDRIILKYLLPEKVADEQIGIYSAFYKLSIIITLFVQAFRFAGEPFFFEHADKSNARQTYARVMNYFTAVCGIVFLFTMLFVKELSSIVVRSEAYYSNPDIEIIVPVLLLANIFLGIYYNLTVWYKLSEKTLLGSSVAIAGAALTILLNLLLVPVLGILGSAVTTLAAYGLMAVAAYLMGQKHYPVPYNVLKIVGYLLLALVLWKLHEVLFSHKTSLLRISSAMLALIIYAMVTLRIELPLKKS